MHEEEATRTTMKSSSHDLDRFKEAHTRVRESARVIETLDLAALFEVSKLVSRTLANGGIIFAAGNGGSAAQAQHLVGELVGRFSAERPGLRAIGLGTDPVTTSAIGNDYGHHEIFTRQLLALARTGDVLVAFSTSGASPNLVEASLRARSAGIHVASFVGDPVSDLANISECFFAVPGQTTAVVQEAHLVGLHSLCQVVEWELGWGT